VGGWLVNQLDFHGSSRGMSKILLPFDGACLPFEHGAGTAVARRFQIRPQMVDTHRQKAKEFSTFYGFSTD